MISTLGTLYHSTFFMFEIFQNTKHKKNSFCLFYLFLAVPGLHCSMGFLSSCSPRASHCGGFLGAEQGSRVCRLQQLQHMGLAAAAWGLQSTGLGVVAHGLSCSRGIFPDGESNPHLLHWQVDFTTEPLRKPPEKQFH